MREDRFPIVDPPAVVEQERREIARLAELELAEEPALPVPYPAEPDRELVIQRRQEDRDREEEARWDR